MIESIAFEDGVPAWRALEAELRRAGGVRWAVREGRPSGRAVGKQLIDLDRPQRPRANLALYARHIEATAAWPEVDQVLVACVALGGARVPPQVVARENGDVIDYYSRYDDGSGKLSFHASRSGDRGETFLIWSGFADVAYEHVHAVEASLGEAWLMCSDDGGPRESRATAMSIVVEKASVALARFVPSDDVPMSFAAHTQACIDDLGRWLLEKRRAEDHVCAARDYL